MRIALTGATGFVGGHVLDALTRQALAVRALTRRPQPDRAHVEWVEGALDAQDSLRRLADGTDAVIHVAGAINAPSKHAFEAANVSGTEAMIAAARAAGVRRFVHVSSLAAREPELSLYGTSKAKAEEVVKDSGLDWAIVRPPAVYGPGDKEMLDLFKMASRGQIFMPPKGRISLLHAADLAGLLVALVRPGSPKTIVMEPDDGKTGGWTHREFGQALARAVGMPARTYSTPRFALNVGSWLDRLVRGQNAKLTPDRVAYFCHPDWVSNPAFAAPADFWKPEIETAQGLKATAEWYSAHRWL